MLDGTRSGDKTWALVSTALIMWGNVTVAKGILQLPGVLALARQLSSAPNRLAVLRQYAGNSVDEVVFQKLPRGTSGYFFKEEGGRRVIQIAENLANSNWRLASTFLHELTHAEQSMIGGAIDVFRRWSTRAMPLGGPWWGDWKYGGLLSYAVNPAEYQAMEVGVNFGLALPRGSELAGSMIHDVVKYPGTYPYHLLCRYIYQNY